MTPPPRDETEHAIRQAAEASDLAAATTAALRGYGPEIFRFLLALHGSETAAADVFSLFSEGVWRGVARFDWASSFRSYAFGIARRASLRYRRDQGRRAAREIPVGDDARLSAVEAEIRSQTLSYLRTASKNRFAELRDALPPEDRALLMLRVDQGLSWIDCARALHDDDASLEGDPLKREAARLRKRFQLVKAGLLEAGVREGLVGGSGDVS